ncbi:trypsin-like peptidase domain-containing protein [bacterium]|nr:trypsin-like peptidase domain-containing protein [bacterium]
MNARVFLVPAALSLLALPPLAPATAQPKDPPLLTKGIKLTPPDLGGKTESGGDLKTAVRLQLLSVDELKALPDDLRLNVLRNTPVGFPTLKKTTKTGPARPLDANDRMVMPLDQQPLVEQYFARTKAKGQPPKKKDKTEAVIRSGNFLPAYFLEAGAIAQRAVGRVAIKYDPLLTAGWGTGFMVSKSLMMTNNHVIPTKEMARNFILNMNYVQDFNGQLSGVRDYEFDPDGFFYTDKALDFTLIRLSPRQDVLPTGGGTPTELHAGEAYGTLKLGTAFGYSPKQLVNVVQHPDGRSREVVLHDNKITGGEGDVIYYTADTEHGSSGSPVFNNSWKLIALHHSAGVQDPETGAWLNNEGIRIDRIVEHLRARVTDRRILDELGL